MSLQKQQPNEDMSLVDVYAASRAPEILYALLEERTPKVNISHLSMPTWDEHLAFLASRPYRAWYLIEVGEEPVGATYLSHANEIGVFLLRQYQRKGYGKFALELLMKRHPCDRFLANINPENEGSIELFCNLGFRHIQNTYERR